MTETTTPEAPALDMLSVSEWDLADLDTRDRNAARQPEIDERCRMCNRPIVGKAYLIHEHESGDLYPADAPDGLEGDFGWHLVGITCGKRLPARYRSTVQHL